LFDRLSGGELLEYCGLLRQLDPHVVAARRDELLTVLDLNDARDTFVIDYSTGMRKKIALAAALLHAPSVLFLDEPFESVDPIATQTIRTVLERFTDQGGTVVFSSHVMEVVERLCDRVGVMHQGRLIAEGQIDDLRQGRRLEEVFVDLIGARVSDDGALAWLGGGQGA
jgi:ABC-2 type transport system ATP-binding protein